MATTTNTATTPSSASTTHRPADMLEVSPTSVLSYQMPMCSQLLIEGPDGITIRQRLAGFNDILKKLHLASVKSAASHASLLALKKRMRRRDPASSSSSSASSSNTSTYSKDTRENRAKLRALYKTTLRDTETEAELSRQSLAAIFDIRRLVRRRQKQITYSLNLQSQMRRGQLMKILTDSGSTLPLFIGRSIEERPPPLCGAIPPEPGYIAGVGDLVAALTRPGNDSDHNWIIAEVIHYDRTSETYEVDDIDEEQKDRHVLAQGSVVPLPTMRANPETDPEALFQKGTLVLALYPQTTCFYRAVVQTPPATAADPYLLLFEDNSFPEGYSPPQEVSQRYVIAFREPK